MNAKKLKGQVKEVFTNKDIITVHVDYGDQLWSVDTKLTSAAKCIEVGDMVELDNDGLSELMAWISKFNDGDMPPILMDVFNVKDITPPERKKHNLTPEPMPVLGKLNHPKGYMTVAGKRYNNGWPVDVKAALLVGVSDPHTVAEAHIEFDDEQESDWVRYKKLFDSTQVKYYEKTCKQNSSLGMIGMTKYLELASVSRLTILFCFSEDGRFLGYAMKD
jgi:hypothetical protein